uniref:NADH-ubiquinone oxidoreductase chain 6 n=1 Tax=Belzebub intermedius TaxID=2306298 RepID=A0A346RNI2_9EUCA|nr:NADH dehydrogenase subunit 6 [Belzebub intermedius]AXS67629.1 NADH dehydrogenase subunit 6 [Belzebub intermedius]
MSLMIFLSLNLLMTSILFSNMMQPLSMGLILLFQTFLVSLFSGMFLSTFWFSYILILVFLGAMLILFVYVSSLAPNQEFKISSAIILAAIFLIFLSFISLFIDPLMIETAYMKMSSFSKALISASPNWMLSMIYSSQSCLVTSIIILYLLLTLIVVVKIVSPFFGPLRLNN